MINVEVLRSMWESWINAKKEHLPSTKHYPTLKTLEINIGIFYLAMKIYEKYLIKDYSLPTEKIPIYAS